MTDQYEAPATDWVSISDCFNTLSIPPQGFGAVMSYFNTTVIVHPQVAGPL